MRRSRQRDQKLASAEVAGNMADAVAYLSRTARDAGLTTISADLKVIQRRLRKTKDKLVAGSRDIPDGLPQNKR
jgi:hypothetical protein